MKTTPLHCVSFFLFFFISFEAFSQEQDYISGRLLDAKTNEPVVFANIRIKDRALGLITNLDGSFRIPLKYKEYGEILEISSMGYQTLELLIQDFSVFDTNIIMLQPSVFELLEATVSADLKRKNLKPKEIVQKAIDAILENYPTKPHSQVGYYRDYQLDEGEYINLNEAILEVYDQGFKATDSLTTKVLIYDYQENVEFRRDTLARKPYNYNFKGGAKKIIDKGYLNAYGGNEFTILSVHNAIRNYRIYSYSFVNRLDTDLLKEHKFSRDNDTSIDGEPLYNIRFEEKFPVHSAYGRLFISKYDYSIFKMEYAVYDETKNNATGLEDANGSNKQKLFEVITSYRKQGDKMYLNYISFNNRFKLWEPPKFTLDSVNVRFDRTIYYKFNRQFRKSAIVLAFSEFLNTDYVKNKKQFNIRFKEQKIGIDSLSISDKRVILYPKFTTKEQITLLDELEFVTKNEGLNEQILSVKVQGLKSVNGHSIGEWANKNHHQFREFFVQEVNQSPKIPSYHLLMNRRKPIFEDQPILRPDNFDEYWMNTPLKKTN